MYMSIWALYNVGFPVYQKNTLILYVTQESVAKYDTKKTPKTGPTIWPKNGVTVLKQYIFSHAVFGSGSSLGGRVLQRFLRRVVGKRIVYELRMIIEVGWHKTIRLHGVSTRRRQFIGRRVGIGKPSHDPYYDVILVLLVHPTTSIRNPYFLTRPSNFLYFAI